MLGSPDVSARPLMTFPNAGPGDRRLDRQRQRRGGVHGGRADPSSAPCRAASVVDRLPGLLLRAEGVAVGIGAILLYFHEGYPWWLFVALMLAPDLSMIGFVAGPTVGAAAYDAAHTYAIPVALAAIGVIADAEVAVQVGLIWLAHIGIDRAIGYGLKHPTGFKDTHLQHV